MIKIVFERDGETFIEKAKRKAWEIKHDAEIKARQVVNYCKDHPEVVAAAVPVIVATGKKIYKGVGDYREEYSRQTRFWDPRMGRYARSRRRLTRREADYVEREYLKGRTYRDILDELGLLQ